MQEATKIHIVPLMTPILFLVFFPGWIFWQHSSEVLLGNNQ